MHVQYHEKHPFEKEKTFSSNRKTIHCFFLSMILFKTPTENDAKHHQIRPG